MTGALVAEVDLPAAGPEPAARRILILAPVGRTGRLTGEILTADGFDAEPCDTMPALCHEIARGAGALLLLEEALATERDARLLAGALQGQPAWSDLPVTVFASDLKRPSAPLRSLTELVAGRGLLMLERPIRAPALVSLMRSLLRARGRQYEIRDLLADLARARGEAEAANLGKSEFLAVMSHELRTPLNAIIGFGDLLHEEIAGPLTEASRGQVERIRRSAWHLLDLIEEILTHARIEAGKEEVELEPACAADLAREAAMVAESLAAKKGLALRVDLPDGRVPVETDTRKVKQILLNLLSNAIKFTDTGEVALTLESASDGGVVFRVRDTGSGIAPHHLETVFRAFEQVDRSLTRRRQGTGLGLGVSRELARLLGGELSVESELEVGSTFTLRLPATPAPG